MIKAKRPLLILNIITIAIVLFGCVAFSIHQLNKFNQQTDAPFLAVINNNLGVKTKVMSLQIAFQQFKAEKTPAALTKLKTKFKIMKGSINNDLKSDVTYNFHEEYGDVNKLSQFQQSFEKLAQVLPSSPDDEENTQQFERHLSKAYKLWNRYSRKIIHAAQSRSLEIHKQWNESLTTQIALMLIIGLTSLIVLIVISRQLFVQRRMSQELQIQAAELTVSRRMAEESTKAKSRFLSNMSHEIRTPLNGIIGLTNLARDKVTNPDIQDYLDKVILSSDALLHVINDILDVSKIESGKLELEITDVKVSDLFDRISATLDANARNKGLALQLFIDKDVPTSFKGDPTRLQQVLNNLISNAIKFTEEGYVQLTVHFDKDTGELSIRVKDTGIGIEPKNLHKLFKEFSQADTSTTRKFGGSGLGLTIAKSLTELMKGKITVESEINNGTTFTVALPIEASDETLLPRHIVVPSVHLITLDKNNQPTLEEALIQSGLEITTKQNAENLVIMLPPTVNELIISSLSKHLSEAGKATYLIGYPDQFEACKTSTSNKLTFINAPFNTSKIANSIAQVEESKEETIDPMSSADFSGRSVLLVEDNHINQLIAQEMLELVGLSITHAENGKIATQKANEREFDLILMDIQMPEMDGIEATKCIRKASKNTTTPIVALTANVMNEDIVNYEEAGMNDHLSKPFKPEELVEKLNAYL